MFGEAIGVRVLGHDLIRRSNGGNRKRCGSRADEWFPPRNTPKQRSRGRTASVPALIVAGIAWRIKL